MISNEPSPLDTITSRGHSDFWSSGRNVFVTRTGPSRLTPKTGTKSAGFVSAGSARVPLIPALFTSTSRPVSASTTASYAAATDWSSVTSSWTTRTSASGCAPRISLATASPAATSRAPSHTVQLRSASRAAVSAPRPWVAPVIRTVV